MKKIYLFLIGITTTLFIYGCGHNVFAYQKGQLINVGYDPNTNKAGIQWVNGESIIVANRENTYFEAELNQDTNATAPSTSGGVSAQSGTISKLKYSTGIQINGYTTDLAAKNPELAKQIITEMAKNGVQVRYFKTENNVMKEITKDEYDNSKENVLKIDGRDLSVKTTLAKPKTEATIPEVTTTAKTDTTAESK